MTLKSKAGAAQTHVLEIVDGVESAKADLEAARAALAEQANIRAQAELDLNAVAADGSEDDALKADERLALETKRLTIATRKVSTLAARYEEARIKAWQLANEAKLATGRAGAKARESAAVGLEVATKAFFDALDVMHAANEKFARVSFEGRPPQAGLLSGTALTRQIALEAGQYSVEDLYGGQRTSTRPNMPAAAGLKDRNQAKINGLSGRLVADVRQSNEFLLNHLKSGLADAPPAGDAAPTMPADVASLFHAPPTAAEKERLQYIFERGVEPGTLDGPKHSADSVMAAMPKVSIGFIDHRKGG